MHSSSSPSQPSVRSHLKVTKTPQKAIYQATGMSLHEVCPQGGKDRWRQRWTQGEDEWEENRSLIFSPSIFLRRVQLQSCLNSYCTQPFSWQQQFVHENCIHVNPSIPPREKCAPCSESGAAVKATSCFVGWHNWKRPFNLKIQYCTADKVLPFWARCYLFCLVL